MREGTLPQLLPQPSACDIFSYEQMQIKFALISNDKLYQIYLNSFIPHHLLTLPYASHYIQKVQPK